MEIHSETSVIKMLSLRNNLSRPEYNFVALAKLMRYILSKKTHEIYISSYSVKYWCNIVDYIHCIKIIQ
jgi:hypothetical protein